MFSSSFARQHIVSAASVHSHVHHGSASLSSVLRAISPLFWLHAPAATSWKAKFMSTISQLFHSVITFRSNTYIMRGYRALRVFQPSANKLQFHRSEGNNDTISQYKINKRSMRPNICHHDGIICGTGGRVGCWLIISSVVQRPNSSSLHAECPQARNWTENDSWCIIGVWK